MRVSRARRVAFGFRHHRSPRVIAVISGCLLLLAFAAWPSRTLDARAAMQAPTGGAPIRVLFLGQDQRQPHDPVRMFPYLAAPLARRGIQLTYAETPAEALKADR